MKIFADRPPPPPLGRDPFGRRLGRSQRQLSIGGVLLSTLVALLLAGCGGPATTPEPAPFDRPPPAVENAHGGALRPAVTGHSGMVAANHPQAAAAGFEILLAGGNAVDAAIAMGAVLGVVEPFMSGIGGTGWMNIYWAETGTVQTLNFGGRAPAALTAEHFEEFGEIPARHALSAMVPGSPAAWHRAHERFGTLTRQQLLDRAIRIAEEGHPLTTFGADIHADHRDLFHEWDGAAARTWWGGSEAAPKAGERVRNPDLAGVYRRLAQEGFRSFYTGPIAREIVDTYQGEGGVIALQDFESYDAIWEDPLHITYRGYDLYNVPPNSSGLAILQIMKTLEGFDIERMGVNSADYIHHVLEAIKLAAADRAEWVGDPDFLEVPIPVEDLLSEEYAEKQRARIDPGKASTDVAPGAMLPGTTHYSIADANGNLVSVTATMGSLFGTGLIGGNTGVFVGNGALWFDLDPESPNHVEGGKRNRWNMGPTLVGRDGVPFLAMGTPGGPGIWQTQPQLLTKLLDFGMDLQNAIESPRFRWELGGVTVLVEGRVPPEVVRELELRGHDVEVLAPWTWVVGGMNAVRRDPETGFVWGGADPRRDGYVMGW